MTESLLARNAFGETLARTQPKTRQCLRCCESFKSEWAGERICTRCKGTTAWRSGTPVVARPAGKGR